MRKNLIAVAMGAALIAAAPMTSVMAAGAAPNMGEYLGYQYFVSSTCANSTGVPGPDRPLAVYWPGAAAKGFRITGPSMDGQSINVDYYPMTPAAGGTSYSGYRERYSYPSGAKSADKFTATLTYISATMFLITQTNNENCGDGTTGSLVSNFAMIAR